MSKCDPFQHWYEMVTKFIGRISISNGEATIDYHRSTPIYARSAFEKAMAEHPGKLICPRCINDYYLFMVLP